MTFQFSSEIDNVILNWLYQSIYYTIHWNTLFVVGKSSGEVLLNGEPVDVEIMLRMSGFVPQQDLAVESLTVQEHMEFMVISFDFEFLKHL